VFMHGGFSGGLGSVVMAIMVHLTPHAAIGRNEVFGCRFLTH
jgi:hypothetical protein